MVTNSRSRSSKLGWMVPVSMHQTSQHDSITLCGFGCWNPEWPTARFLRLSKSQGWKMRTTFDPCVASEGMPQSWLHKRIPQNACAGLMVYLVCGSGGELPAVRQALESHRLQWILRDWKRTLWMEYLTEDCPRTLLDMALRKKKKKRPYDYRISCHSLVEFAHFHSIPVA